MSWANKARLEREALFHRGARRDEIQRDWTRHEPNAAIYHGQCVSSEQRLLWTIEIGDVSGSVTRRGNDFKFVQYEVTVLNKVLGRNGSGRRLAQETFEEYEKSYFGNPFAQPSSQAPRPSLSCKLWFVTAMIVHGCAAFSV